MPVSLSEYKKSKRSQVIVEELEAVLSIVRLTIKGLRLFRYYSPVQDILRQLHDSKTILEIHLNNHKKIVDKKGEDG